MTTLMLAELVAKPISDDREMHIREMAKVNIKALRTEKGILKHCSLPKTFKHKKCIRSSFY